MLDFDYNIDMRTIIIAVIVLAIVILLSFLLAVANFSGEKFFERYEQLCKERPSCDMNSLDFVGEINYKHFENSLKIAKTPQRAGDCYGAGVLCLSNETLSNPSLASFTIIAHEMGHARQDKEGGKLKVLNRLRRVGRVLGGFLLPLIVAGGVCILLMQEKLFIGLSLLGGGVIIFLIALFIKLRTISIEKEASKYAIDYLNECLPASEVKICKKFLDDARLTYWADFLRTLFFWTMLTKKSKIFN